MPSPQKKNYADLNKRLDRYCVAVRRAYDECSNKAAKVAYSSGYVTGDVPFSFSSYPELTSRIDKVMSTYRKDMETIIVSGMKKEWDRANNVQTEFAQRTLKYYYKDEEGSKKRIYYKPNYEARDAFIARKDNGITLSSRIWNLSESYKKGIEKTISIALERGTDSKTLAKQLAKYLKETDKVNKEYKKRYGVNGDAENVDWRALRLARSEINMAYRRAEQERWRQYDFVIGFRVHTSESSHGKVDICDELQGDYPKWFDFWGWHPCCRCYSEPILKSFQGYVDGSNEDISELPNEFVYWSGVHEDKIYDSIEKGTSLQWMRYRNIDYVKGSNIKDYLTSKKNHLFFKEDTLAEQEATIFTKEQIKNHEEIAKILKQKLGDRMSFKKADSNKTNPNFSYIERIIFGDSSKYNTNCTLTSFCHELRMRGFDVTSLGLELTNKLHRQLATGLYNKLWIDPKTMKTPNFMLLRCNENNIIKKLQKLGCGRYQFEVKWKKSYRHVSCFDILPNGDIRFYDPQDNSLNVVSWIKNVDFKKDVKILKVDGLMINPNYVKEVVVNR